jgi:hypothetical protein
MEDEDCESTCTRLDCRERGCIGPVKKTSIVRSPLCDAECLAKLEQKATFVGDEVSKMIETIKSFLKPERRPHA